MAVAMLDAAGSTAASAAACAGPRFHTAGTIPAATASFRSDPYLHLSKEEQRKRFLARVDEPEKNWKFSLADIEERKFWKQYMKAYEECLGATSTRRAPWYVVPADDKENARLIVSRIVLDTLDELKMTYPKTSAARRSIPGAAAKRAAIRHFICGNRPVCALPRLPATGGLSSNDAHP
jgi:Polyphosphate kinase 2 (PPK2)